ncbi:hypothetical protein PHO31112_00744 [Pandoraea horticolens]|uniref:Phage-related protein n=1 Tax=Pandoraea horticolens TaxID=2508298 RepID=A0A5E4SE58_9BURK|nr:hypothetical protein [Pandoraea horticolens]VVD74186.1 hypothetical protein PHO31112_00744 [Pandoraea horticolens]
MKERPILFSAPMVRAILDGSKTQTRRVMTPQPQWRPNYGRAVGMQGAWVIGSPAAIGLKERGDHWIAVFDEDTQRRFCTQEAYGWGASAGSPYGVVGDHLWVRETTYNVERNGYVGPVFVESEEGRNAAAWGYGESDDPDFIEPHELRKRPAIHMPRSMCRLVLEITGVRIERLMSISDEDAIAEGARLSYGEPFDTANTISARRCFELLWTDINGPGSWDANPWVWVIEFQRSAGERKS